MSPTFRRPSPKDRSGPFIPWFLVIRLCLGKACKMKPSWSGLVGNCWCSTERGPFTMCWLEFTSVIKPWSIPTPTMMMILTNQWSPSSWLERSQYFLVVYLPGCKRCNLFVLKAHDSVPAVDRHGSTFLGSRQIGARGGRVPQEGWPHQGAAAMCASGESKTTQSREVEMWRDLW